MNFHPIYDFSRARTHPINQDNKSFLIYYHQENHRASDMELNEFNSLINRANEVHYERNREMKSF